MTTVDQSELEVLADAVLATLADSDPRVLYAFAGGLRMARPPVSAFRLPVQYAAGDIEDGRVDGWLARDTMVIALEQAVRDEEFVERVADAQEPFWRAVSNALAALSGTTSPV